MKNITTPRTLAACTWETGYRSVELRHAARWPERIVYILACACAAAAWWGWM